MGLGTIALSGAFVLVLVLLNVYVAQSSFQLNELQQRVGQEQNRYREMRYRVSMAQAPARLAETAQKRGLVVPAHQESLEGRPSPVPALPPGDSELAAGRSLKAVLAGTP